MRCSTHPFKCSLRHAALCIRTILSRTFLPDDSCNLPGISILVDFCRQAFETIESSCVSLNMRISQFMLSKSTYSRCFMYLRHPSTLDDLALVQYAGSNIRVKRHNIDRIPQRFWQGDRRLVILVCVDILRIIISALLPSVPHILFV